MYTLKKSLGQHFLKDENICRKIVEQLQKKSFSQLLEVGPGGGALTKYLLQIQNINFKTVELDEEKVNYLISIYPDLNSKIIHQNFLDIDIPFEGAFTVIGNFPYNISSQILFKGAPVFLSWMTCRYALPPRPCNGVASTASPSRARGSAMSIWPRTDDGSTGPTILATHCGCGSSQ